MIYCGISEYQSENKVVRVFNKKLAKICIALHSFDCANINNTQMSICGLFGYGITISWSKDSRLLQNLNFKLFVLLMYL